MDDLGVAPRVRLFLLRIEAATATADTSFRKLVDRLHTASVPWPANPDAAPPALQTVSLEAPRHAQEAMAFLSAAEAQRARHLRAPMARDAFVCVHAALRLLLAPELRMATPPLDEFERGALGKPFIAGQAGVHFSLSYRPGAAAIALATAPVGVDIEQMTVDIDIDAIGRRFFTPREQAYLAEVPPAERRVRFFALWTRKEALLKSVGAGVDAMPMADALKSAVTLATPDGTPACVCLHSLAAPADCALALAVRIPHSLAAATAATDGPSAN